MNRDFSARRPSQTWVSDIAYIATDEGWLYLAVVLDLYARKAVDWALCERTRAKRPCDAARMVLWGVQAAARRHPPLR